MTTLSATPTYPIPNRPARVTFSFSNGAANYIRVWCTVAPEGSGIASALEESQASRVLVYEGEGGADHPWRKAFDKGGAYTLLAQEYVKGNAWGGGYEGDTRGAPTETKSGGETTLSLYVAQRLTQELGHGDDRATLVLYAVNDTIRQTTAAVHGEASPAIVDPTSDRARTASKTALVTAAALALRDLSPSTAMGSLGDIVDNFIAEFADHSVTVAYHENADSQVDLEENYSGSTSLGGIAKALNKVRTRLGQHMLNSKENVAANPEYALPGGFEIHKESGVFFDLKNTLLPITADENNPATIFQAIGDYFRAYEAHRIANMHDNIDDFNTLTALPALPDLHRLFMASLAAISPTAEPGQSTGAAVLIGTAGFLET